VPARPDAPEAPEPSVVLVPGPWTHREVGANGQRFHIASAGDPDAPLVLLLHGFPEFWWSWRHQLTALGAAGYHAVAADLRGYGASDKPPRGYDGPTLGADVAGLVRALGGSPAHLVGHDWGGVLGWWVAATHPEVVRSLTAVSSPHPLRLRAALTSRGGQARHSAYLARFQLPRADAWLADDGAAEVGQLLARWGGPGFPDAETDERCRQAMLVPGAAHCALEYYRWAVRSQLRPSGQRFARRAARPVEAPVLQLHGALDGCFLPQTAQGSGRWVRGPYTWRLLDGLGHFPHEEDPALVSGVLLDWLTALPAGPKP